MAKKNSTLVTILILVAMFVGINIMFGIKWYIAKKNESKSSGTTTTMILEKIDSTTDTKEE